MFEDFLRSLQKIAALDGTVVDISKEKEVWSKFIEVHPTKEEAIHAYNADALKKHRPLEKIKGMGDNEVRDRAIEKHAEDFIKRALNG
jgi:hypothetical protein